MRRFIIAYSCLFVALTAAVAHGQVAPPNFRTLPGVGAFSANQVGRWDATAKKFVGGPLTANAAHIVSSQLLGGAEIDYYAGNLIAPASDPGPTVANTYLRTVVPADATSFRGIVSEVQSNNANQGIKAVSGLSYYTGSGTAQSMYGTEGITINQGVGTDPLQLGVLGQSSNTGAGTVTLLYGVRARGIQSGVGTVATGASVKAEGILTAGTVGAFSGLDLTGWAGGATVTDNAAIRADTSIDFGTTHHFINSTSASASLLAGDLAYTDSAKGPVLKDSVTGHYVRLTLANGVLTQTDLGTSAP